MATVTLRLAPRPAHVRTARLVASATARRGGVPEDLLDDVRLAVGEACARAVRLHERHGTNASIVLELIDGPNFTVIVTDSVPDGAPGDVTGNGAGEAVAQPVELAGSAVAGRGEPTSVGHAAPVVPSGSAPAGTAPAGTGGLLGAAEVSPAHGAREPAGTAGGSDAGAGDARWAWSERLRLAVLAGVVDDLTVERGPGGTRVHMRWPVGG